MLLFLMLVGWHATAPTAVAEHVEQRQEQRQALKDCLMEDRPQLRITTWNESLLSDTLPNLVLHELWWSKRPRRFDVTVVTQLSIDRIPALFNQCTTYLGPMSAAVYLPLVHPLDQPRGTLSSAHEAQLEDQAAQMTTMFKKMEAADKCQLDMMLLYEVFDHKDSAMLYPVNSLRNFARMQVRTPLLSAIDVDMMISAGLSEDLNDKVRLAQLAARALIKVATVLPAFEPSRQGVVGRQMADKAVTVSKAELEQMFNTRLMLQFKKKVFKRGHTPTNYTRWLKTDTAYMVPYKHMYEPWFITHWDVMPWFHSDFKGYGLNKIVYVASLNYFGFTFETHPQAWLVHRPHEDTKVRKMVARQASDVNKLNARLPTHALYTKVTRLFGLAKRAMIKGTFMPRLDPRIQQCMTKLPWLQQLKAMAGTPIDPSVFV
mmetsp:Transcript_21809/g.37226  ORF Transcript_21809/g.37226 Transcript_21809/m.37226 type:complete len:431 (-) Transcript_21809:13-1305(-)